MLTGLIALFVGLGGGGGIAALIQSFFARRNDRIRVDLDEDKFAQDSLQKIIENLWKDNDTLRTSDTLKTQRIHVLEQEVDELKIVIKTLQSRLDSLEKGYNGV